MSGICHGDDIKTTKPGTKPSFVAFTYFFSISRQLRATAHHAAGQRTTALPVVPSARRTT
uniref:hypothetical protein n=1 Tax=Candidatus Limisoma sp. TaxID=3076476 RepID=UPI003FEEB696